MEDKNTIQQCVNCMRWHILPTLKHKTVVTEIYQTYQVYTRLKRNEQQSRETSLRILGVILLVAVFCPQHYKTECQDGIILSWLPSSICFVNLCSREGFKYDILKSYHPNVYFVNIRFVQDLYCCVVKKMYIK